MGIIRLLGQEVVDKKCSVQRWLRAGLTETVMSMAILDVGTSQTCAYLFPTLVIIKCKL